MLITFSIDLQCNRIIIVGSVDHKKWGLLKSGSVITSNQYFDTQQNRSTDFRGNVKRMLNRMSWGTHSICNLIVILRFSLAMLRLAFLPSRVIKDDLQVLTSGELCDSNEVCRELFPAGQKVDRALAAKQAIQLVINRMLTFQYASIS